MMVLESKKKTVKTFTHGRHYKVKLRGKMKSDGFWSLYLEYYLGMKKTNDGNSIAQRKFEFLDIHIKDKPSNPQERKEYKEKLDFALEVRENRQREIQYSQEGIIDPKRRQINFIDYFQKFHDNYPNKDIRIVRYCLKYFKAFVGESYIAPHEITEDFLRRFKMHLENHLNGETPHNYFTKMKKVVKQAYIDKILINNTGENITNKRNEGLKKDILSLEEIQKLATVKCGNEEIKRAFLFSLNTGLRFCDLKELKGQNIYNDKVMIKSQKKTGIPVYIDLNENAKKILASKKIVYNELVFQLPSLTGCLKTLKTWTNNAGIQKNITWHSARHSIAVNMLTLGTDIKTVSGILGHAGLKHTEKYTRIVDELKKKAVNSLPNIEL
jgi:site-specific recombinase XerD